MQDQGEESPLVFSGEMKPYVIEDYKLQANDIVDINIKTSSKELNELIEIFQEDSRGGGMMMQGARGGGDIFFMNGYSIDENGMVELPLIGELKFAGLTAKEAKLLIESRMVEFVNEEDLFVRVRLGGIRYSALGEFNAAGKHSILQNRVTIFEAIANAGDLTVVAKRDELVLVRQYPEGSRMFRINLNNQKLLTSEFYFIQPNDMLYAEPMKIRELGTGVNFVQTFQLAVTTLSAVLLVLNAIN
ncbi:polysaccharide biosynthesis/export family protein [Pararhodonellum marinum]|uniref:polysaccharide biosynthesis/export family protein n=1 Tax=Pararhodonellum marinum TaxID=2755358 RepID=UPI00188E22BB|nr:polysaccharide biosynthesis/export family protein [Pararhodonellum marinum]